MGDRKQPTDPPDGNQKPDPPPAPPSKREPQASYYDTLGRRTKPQWDEDKSTERAKCGAQCAGNLRNFHCDRDRGHLGYHFDSVTGAGWKQQPIVGDVGEPSAREVLQRLRQSYSEFRSIVAAQPHDVAQSLAALDYCLRVVDDTISELP